MLLYKDVLCQYTRFLMGSPVLVVNLYLGDFKIVLNYNRIEENTELKKFDKN